MCNFTIQVAKAIRANPGLRHIPIILFTATSRNITRKREALNAGVDVFLNRSIPNRELLETVARLLTAS